MELHTISAQEKADIQAQVRLLGRLALAIALMIYIAMIVGSSYVSPEFISRAQPYFLNPPDLSKCAPLFSARVTAHIAFAHAVFMFSAFVYVVSLLSRWQAGQFSRTRLTKLVIPLLFILIAAIPMLSSDFLMFKAGRLGVAYHFVDFCASSWDRPALVYFLPLGFWLVYQLVAILMSVGEFVFSGHRQWSDSVSSDPETAAVQLATRLEYGVIDQQTFDETAEKLKLK